MKTMSDAVPVLDRGFVQYVDHMGNDLTVVNAARVSFAKESEWEGERHWTGAIKDKTLSEKDSKLIRYLAKHNHWTPFAHPQITLRIKAPIFIRTQLFKHKVGMTENEISRRYVTFEPEIYLPQWRTAPTNGAKQGSDDFIQDAFKAAELERGYQTIVQTCVAHYNHLLSQGVAPEQARSVLPQGTYTEWWWTGSLSAYARVCKLRSDNHAQWEIREYAKAISAIISPLFPASWEALTSQ
jgi:thymidylate synthase (FAD)